MGLVGRLSLCARQRFSIQAAHGLEYQAVERANLGYRTIKVPLVRWQTSRAISGVSFQPEDPSLENLRIGLWL